MKLAAAASEKPRPHWVLARMSRELGVRRVLPVMYARAVDDAAARLRELRHEEWEDLGLAALALGLAVAATELRLSLALPLFLGGLAVGFFGVRARWHRWDLVERLAEDRDAHVLPEVLEHASREATMERRQTFAALIRGRLRPGSGLGSRLSAAADELEPLASELEDRRLVLEPVSAVACARLLSDVEGSLPSMRRCRRSCCARMFARSVPGSDAVELAA